MYTHVLNHFNSPLIEIPIELKFVVSISRQEQPISTNDGYNPTNKNAYIFKLCKKSSHYPLGGRVFVIAGSRDGKISIPGLDFF